ncbi:MAG: metallophosphoesterase, partial [Bacteroidia bacterium]|nr:metallophosphoesterase [Bacteroidia bacterium]
MRINQYLTLFSFIFLFNACATYKPQYKDVNRLQNFPIDKEIEHSFYIIGDAGNSEMGQVSLALQGFEKELKNASKNSTAIFLGDNIYEVGLEDKNHPNRKLSEHRLDAQINTVSDYKGQTIFVPGNHDWYSGVKGVKRQEKYVEKALGKNTFLPENGCPIEKVNISDDVILLILDSQWYITNWNKHPTINDDCEIKTRDLFFDEFESQIKKARGKTTLITVHNPLFTNGSHGGQYSFKSHMKPLPILGTLKNLLRKTGGVANVDDQNKIYREFKERLITLSQEHNKVIFVSG